MAKKTSRAYREISVEYSHGSIRTVASENEVKNGAKISLEGKELLVSLTDLKDLAEAIDMFVSDVESHNKIADENVRALRAKK